MKSKFTSNYKLFFNLNFKLLKTYVVLLLVFMLFRFYILFNFGSYSELKIFKLDILKAFYVGGKFDTSVIAYALLPLFLINFVFAILISKNGKAIKTLLKTSRIYVIIVSILLVVLSLIDYFFYKFFQTHISPVIFGIKNDNTSAVLASIWSDYPVIRIAILMLIILIIFIKVYNKIYRNNLSKTFSINKLNGLYVLLIIGFYFLAMRGTIGKFPLRQDHTSVSTNTFVNELVLNGPFAFRIANDLNNEYNTFDTDTNKTIKNYYFKDKKDVLKTYLENPNPTNFNKAKFAKTAVNKFVESNPPNIVFILVEGLGRHYFDLHTNKTNLLGNLEAELPSLYYFKNMLSARNGTIQTLESILVGTPQSSIAQSPFFNINYTGSVANPFNESGYQTTYITGDNLGWRNTGNFIKAQNFDKTLGLNFLVKKYKNPEQFTWGVHDEYLYNHILDQLNNAKKPQMIFALTVSNHTPNDVPSTFRPRPIKLTQAIKNKNRTSEDFISKNFISYQYAANSLGNFIHKIKTSPLGKNTIIVATGDHNVRGMFNYTTNELFLKRSVPILMYVPNKYKPNNIDLKRFGSHKDIFPTLFNLALSNKKYIKTGNDLFGDGNQNFYAQNNHKLAANKIGVVVREGKIQYYKWKDTINFIGLQATTKEKSPELYKLRRKLDAHYTFTMLNIQQDILDK